MAPKKKKGITGTFYFLYNLKNDLVTRKKVQTLVRIPQINTYFLKGQILQIYMYFLKGHFLQIYMYF